MGNEDHGCTLDGDLLQALLQVVQSNGLDDDLGGWWSCHRLTPEVYRISFKYADGEDVDEHAAFHVQIRITEVPIQSAFDD